MAKPRDPGRVRSFRPMLLEALAEMLDELAWPEPGLANVLAEVLTGVARRSAKGVA